MKLYTAAALTIAATCLTSGTHVAAAQTPVSATMSVVGTDVVTTATVPVTSSTVYVARGYTYDLYATCWSRAGKPQASYEQRVAVGARVPGGAGSYQMRVPSDARTSFTFTDPVAMLAYPQTGTRAITCPKRLTPGEYRAHVTSSDLSVTSDIDGTQTVTRPQSLVAYFPAP